MTPRPSEGARIGHFRVVRQIGAGGAGVVYLAEDLDIPGRRVALKLLRPEAARGDAGALRHEAAVLAALEHPHILVVHEIGESDHGLFLATELMPGGSMASRLKASPLTESEALVAARQAASALAAAHARGVLHRDFKPGNLLVAGDGRVKVSDFGLAVRGDAAPSDEADGTTGEDDATRTTALPSGTSDARILGTPFYIPPESLEGAVQDPKGDQFAFGVALHEMLAGRKPYDTARGLAAVFDPPSVDPSIAPDLGRIVARCLARDPEGRFEGMEAVVAALDVAVARRSPERRRTLRIAVVATALVTILVAAWGGARLYAAREARRLNEDGRAAFERGDLEGARRAFAGAHRADPRQLPPCVNLGALALGEKNPAWAVPILADCAEAFPDSEVVLYDYGAALRLKGDLPESERVLAEAARRAEGRPLELAVANERALVLTALGRPGEAIALLSPRRPATAATVEQAFLLKSLGSALRASGRDTEAAEVLRASLSGALPPGARGEALVALGASCEATGDLSGALAAYAEALARESDADVSAAAREGLARLQVGATSRPR